jgi:hypothetical protein
LPTPLPPKAYRRGISFAENGNSRYAQPFGGLHHTQGNLATIGHQQFVEEL